jgi:hypothetical protein
VKQNGISRKKLIVVFTIAGIILFVAGAFMAVDWINFTYGHGNKFTSYAKVFTSLLCAIVAWVIGRDGIDKRDKALLGAAFLCIVSTDILMNAVAVIKPRASETMVLKAFIAGAVLSTMAHLILIIRHGRGFKWLSAKESGRSLAATLSLPVFVYLVGGVSFILLFPHLDEIELFYPGLFYATFVTTSLWIGWETVRNRLYPRFNAYMIAIAMTLWFLTEIMGLIYNIQIGTISTVCYNIEWLFYGPSILLLALSGYRWSDK